MNARTFQTIARLAVCAGITGILALGLGTTHHTTADQATTGTVLIADGPASNPWEG
jgi:hypothetical protein